MNVLPLAAQRSQMFGQRVLNPDDLATRESVVFPKAERPVRTAQVEYSLTASSNCVHMGWPMIIWADNYPDTTEPEDCRQHFIVAIFPSSWVLLGLYARRTCASGELFRYAALFRGPRRYSRISHVSRHEYPGRKAPIKSTAL